MSLPATRRINRGRYHSYEIDGAPVPGITSILNKGIPKPAFIAVAAKDTAQYAIDYWDELAELRLSERLERLLGARLDKLRKAGKRGTDVHKFAQRLQAGEEVDVPEELDGFVRAYLRFDEEWKPVEIMVEQPVFHRRLGYAGTPDLVARLRDGQTWLLDWKTTASGIWPENALQLAAARFAEFTLDQAGNEISVPKVDAAGCVWLRDDASYELVPVAADLEAFEAFLYAKHVAAFVDAERDHWVADALLPPASEEAA
jgi:hypothetical protein